MPIGSARVSVNDTVDEVASARDSGSQLIKNKGSDPVYLGDSAVTSSTGFELAAGEAVVVHLSGEDKLYGICATGQSVTLHKLKE